VNTKQHVTLSRQMSEKCLILRSQNDANDRKCEMTEKCTVGGQIKLGHLKFNLCKSDH
jgi:hypothetical protein